MSERQRSPLTAGQPHPRVHSAAAVGVVHAQQQAALQQQQLHAVQPPGRARHQAEHKAVHMLRSPPPGSSITVAIAITITIIVTIISAIIVSAIIVSIIIVIIVITFAAACWHTAATVAAVRVGV